MNRQELMIIMIALIAIIYLFFNKKEGFDINSPISKKLYLLDNPSFVLHFEKNLLTAINSPSYTPFFNFNTSNKIIPLNFNLNGEFLYLHADYTEQNKMLTGINTIFGSNNLLTRNNLVENEGSITYQTNSKVFSNVINYDIIEHILYFTYENKIYYLQLKSSDNYSVHWSNDIKNATKILF